MRAWSFSRPCTHTYNNVMYDGHVGFSLGCFYCCTWYVFSNNQSSFIFAFRQSVRCTRMEKEWTFCFRWTVVQPGDWIQPNKGYCTRNQVWSHTFRHQVRGSRGRWICYCTSNIEVVLVFALLLLLLLLYILFILKTACRCCCCKILRTVWTHSWYMPVLLLCARQALFSLAHYYLKLGWDVPLGAQNRSGNCQKAFSSGILPLETKKQL